MLESIRLCNYIMVEDIEIDFSSHLNVFTGETGAGKSLILGAINILLGDRIKNNPLKNKNVNCEIVGKFNVSRKNILNEFNEIIDDSRTFVIKRIITPDLRSKCYINDKTISITILKNIGKKLVDLHGQNTEQSLLDSNEQLRILDRFGSLEDAVKEVSVLFNQKSELERNIALLKDSTNKVKEMQELYEFQKKEIKDANIYETEEEELELEYKKLLNVEKLKKIVDNICFNLHEDNNSVDERIVLLQNELGKISEYNKDFSSLKEDVEKSGNILNEVYSQISSFKHSLEFDPKRFDAVLERLELIKKLKGKYGKTLHEVLSYKFSIEQKLLNLDNKEIDEKDLKLNLNKIEQKLLVLANDLSSKRKQVKKELCVLLENSIKDLNMEQVSFDIEIKPCLINGYGLDHIEFLIKTNVGQNFKPIRDIASGGELSRIMLGIKSVLTKQDAVPLLIFDEVDSGLGGNTAFKVGRKLSTLAGSHQVICITHLAQVAMFSDAHFFVHKIVKDNETIILVDKLENKSKIVNELARMISSQKLESTALQHAREMFEIARKDKVEV